MRNYIKEMWLPGIFAMLVQVFFSPFSLYSLHSHLGEFTDYKNENFKGGKGNKTIILTKKTLP